MNDAKDIVLQSLATAITSAYELGSAAGYDLHVLDYAASERPYKPGESDDLWRSGSTPRYGWVYTGADIYATFPRPRTRDEWVADRKGSDLKVVMETIRNA